MSFFDNVRFPFFTLQELNLDWILNIVREFKNSLPQSEDTAISDNDTITFSDVSDDETKKIKVANIFDSMCSNGMPLMNGTGNAGTSKKPSRYDHVHPSDTSRAPISFFQNGTKLKVSNGGTGGTTAAEARTNLHVLADTLSDGIILSFPNPDGAVFTCAKRTSASLIIDIPFEMAIPDNKTFTPNLTCSWIFGNGESNLNPTISAMVVKMNDHLLRVLITPSGITLTNFMVYQLLLVGDITMS